jgi:four helix bundle protein
MTTERSFKDLIVWQKSVISAKEMYKITAQFPQSERYGLAGQLNRAAVSIPSNIAEGAKRGTKKDFVHFLRMASGSAAEVETQLIIAKDLYTHINFGNVESLLSEVQKMLTVMIRNMK